MNFLKIITFKPCVSEELIKKKPIKQFYYYFSELECYCVKKYEINVIFLNIISKVLNNVGYYY